MNNPGIISLGDFTIGAAVAAPGIIGEWVTGLDGMLGATIQLRFAWGSGGSSVRAYVQTSLDQGSAAVDIACVLFGAASETAILNLSGLTPKTTQVNPTDGALADDTCVDGVLGDRFRVRLVSTGTYSGQTVLSARACVR